MHYICQIDGNIIKKSVKVTGTRLIVKIIFDDVINILANKSITTCGSTSWSVSAMISSLNDYRKPLLNCVGSLPLLKFTTRATEIIIHQKW